MTFQSTGTGIGVQAVDLSQSFNGTAPYFINSLRFGAFNEALNQTIDAVDPYLGTGRFIYVRAPSTDTAGATISSITVNGNTATVTTSSAHNLTTGTKVVLVGQVPNTYVGTYVVQSVPTTTTYTITVANVTTSASTVGTYTYGTIRTGAVVSFSQSIVSGSLVQTVGLWDGTSNTGRSLGVAYTSLLANEYGWVQIAGNAVVNAAAIASVGAPVYYGGAVGVVSTTAATGKQVLNAQTVASIGSVIGVGGDAITLPSATTTSSQGVIYINNPFAQGAIT
jgi:hypothetical protein